MKIARLFVFLITSSLVGENLCGIFSEAFGKNTISKTELPSLFVKCDVTLSLVDGNLCLDKLKQLFHSMPIPAESSTIRLSTPSEQLKLETKPPHKCDEITKGPYILEPSPTSQLIESKSTPKLQPSDEILFENYISLMMTQSFAKDLFAKDAEPTKDDKLRVGKQIPADQKLTTLKHYNGKEAGALFSLVLDFLSHKLYADEFLEKLKQFDCSTPEKEKESRKSLFDYFTRKYPKLNAKMLIKLMIVREIIRAFHWEDYSHTTDTRYWNSLVTLLYGRKVINLASQSDCIYNGLKYLGTEFENNEENFLQQIGADPQISTLKRWLALVKDCPKILK